MCVQESVDDVSFSQLHEQLAIDRGSTVTVTFAVSIGQGSDYQVTWGYFGQVYETDSDSQEIEFTAVGTYDVSVTVQNDISSVVVTTTVYAYETISEITIFLNDVDFTHGGGIETNEPFSLNLGVSQGSSVSWNVTLTDVASGDHVDSVLLSSDTTGSAVYQHTAGALDPTQWQFVVVAYNPASSEQQTMTISFDETVSGLEVSANTTTVDMPPGAVEFTVTLETGSSVSYNWVITTSDDVTVYELAAAAEPTLVWSATTAGELTVNVTAYNNISQTSGGLEFVVWQVYDVTIILSGTNTSPYVHVDDVIDFSVQFDDFTAPVYEWSLTDDTWNSSQRADVSPTHTFASEGVFVLSVNLTEGYSKAYSEMAVHAEYDVEGLSLTVDGENATFLVDDVVYFNYSVTHGTDVSYTWTVYELHDTILGAEVTDAIVVEEAGVNRASLLLTLAGSFRVTLTASNGVSSLRESLDLLALEPVTGLQIVDWRSYVPVGQEITLEASIEAGVWIFSISDLKLSDDKRTTLRYAHHV